MSKVLIVGNPGDLHVRHLQAAIRARGHESQVLQIPRLPEAATVVVRPAHPLRAHVSDGDGRHLIDDVSAVWYRRQGRPELPLDVTDPDDKEFALREWEQTLDGIFLSLDIKLVNAVDAQRAAVKPRQLCVASACGLRIPDTLITSDPAAALEFVEEHDGRVVHKTMVSPRQQFAATQLWRLEDRAFLDQLRIAPVMFQELVTGHSEVRATVVGSQIMAARIQTAAGSVDSRLDPDAPCERMALPAEVTHRLHQMMASLGLTFGTVDMKITDDGEYVFFEVNPQGQFLYVEILANLPISNALADLLVS